MCYRVGRDIMTKIRLNLASGQVQERELITAFNCNNVKYIVFDGESIGSMGLPIILVSKESLGKCVGINDAEEWKNTKECLKKIIAGEKIEYIKVAPELKSDDVYYRQLTLPIASFDLLKNNYVEPSDTTSQVDNSNDIPFMDAINKVDENPIVSPEAPIFTVNEPSNEVKDVTPVINEPTVTSETNNTSSNSVNDNYNNLKAEFLKASEEFFDKIYNMINH